MRPKLEYLIREDEAVAVEIYQIPCQVVDDQGQSAKVEDWLTCEQWQELIDLVLQRFMDCLILSDPMASAKLKDSPDVVVSTGKTLRVASVVRDNKFSTRILSMSPTTKKYHLSRKKLAVSVALVSKDQAEEKSYTKDLFNVLGYQRNTESGEISRYFAKI